MSDKNKKQELIAEITAKLKKGMVLDASRMRVECIFYTINGAYRPCLCINASGEVAVDYFEEDNPIALADQVGLQCSYGWPLQDIVVESLDSINQSMVKP